MRSTRGLLIALCLLGAIVGGILSHPSATYAQDGGVIEHRVEPGDSLYRIAQQYGVTVFEIAQLNNITNPNIIVIGQVLKIPVSDAVVEPTDEVTPTTVPEVTVTPTETSPSEEIIHIVASGDNLYRIASRYGTTVRAISELNNLENPNLIHIGLQLRIPATATNPPTPTVAPEETALPTAEPVETGEATQVPAETATEEATADPGVIATEEATEVVPDVTEEPTVQPTEEATQELLPPAGSSVAFAYGVEVNMFGQDKAAIATRLSQLGVTWVKQSVSWNDMEPVKGTILWDELDQIVSTINSNGMRLMLTVTDAPGWARNDAEGSGPPIDNADFATFLNAVAARYKGSVGAYEIWEEPNAITHWNGASYGKPLSAASYAEMVRVGRDAIKTADPDTAVVSAGLLPTGVTNENTIEDRTFLRQMYQAGIAGYTDAIGVHPASAANPPDSTCCENNPEILGWDDHPSFFFLNTLQDYRAIMNENGDSGKFLWVTQFGWGSSDGLSLTPPESLGFVGFTSLDEQADYTIRAFQKGRELGYIGPMFVWSLNLCQESGIGSVECYWGLLNPAGDPRPAFNVLADTPK